MWWTTAEHWAQLPVELPKTRHAPEYFSTYKGDRASSLSDGSLRRSLR